MVAEAYSESHRAMAKKIGLGRKPGKPAQAEPEAKAVKPRAARSARTTGKAPSQSGARE